ncbi:hypothetical protein LPJ56_001915, partial [Coemansia sp. RSA 2599]
MEHEEMLRDAANPKPKKPRQRQHAQEDNDDEDDEEDDDDGFVVSPRKRRTALDRLDDDSPRFKSKAIVSDTESDSDSEGAPAQDDDDNAPEDKKDP